jgi:hypothetical protein
MCWFFRANKQLRKLIQRREINMNIMHGDKAANFKAQNLTEGKNKFCRDLQSSVTPLGN